MLYPDHIEHRFNHAPVTTGLRAASDADGQQGREQAVITASPRREAIRLAASVAGNMLLGSLLLGSLLMAPLWLQGLLLPLL